MPVAAGVAEAVAGDAAEFAATAGEDYELLFCIAPERWERAAGGPAPGWPDPARPGRRRAPASRCSGRGGVPVGGLRGYEHG